MPRIFDEDFVSKEKEYGISDCGEDDDFDKRSHDQPLTKPILQRAACKAEWRDGPWSPCFDGLRTREVFQDVSTIMVMIVMTLSG